MNISKYGNNFCPNFSPPSLRAITTSSAHLININFEITNTLEDVSQKAFQEKPAQTEPAKIKKATFPADAKPIIAPFHNYQSDYQREMMKKSVDNHLVPPCSAIHDGDSYEISSHEMLCILDKHLIEDNKSYESLREKILNENEWYFSAEYVEWKSKTPELFNKETVTKSEILDLLDGQAAAFINHISHLRKTILARKIDWHHTSAFFWYLTHYLNNVPDEVKRAVEACKFSNMGTNKE